MCCSDVLTVDVRQCARDLAVPRSSVKLVTVLLEGKTVDVCQCDSCVGVASDRCQFTTHAIHHCVSLSLGLTFSPSPSAASSFTHYYVFQAERFMS